MLVPYKLCTHFAHRHIYTPLGNLLLLLAHGNRPCHSHTLPITSPNSYTHTHVPISLQRSPSLSPGCSVKCSVFQPPTSLACLEACQGGVDKLRSKVNRKSGGRQRKGLVSERGGAGENEGGVNCTWVEFVRSMWECNQPKVHSKFVFKLAFVLFLYSWNVLYQKYNISKPFFLDKSVLISLDFGKSVQFCCVCLYISSEITYMNIE